MSETAQGGTNASALPSSINLVRIFCEKSCHMKLPRYSFRYGWKRLRIQAVSSRFDARPAAFILDTRASNWQYGRVRSGEQAAMKTFLLRLFTWWNSQTFGTQWSTWLYG
ncbi:MAG: hypothetical protein WBF07_20215, partial [Xanthobacteraceae bacterium]